MKSKELLKAISEAKSETIKDVKSVGDAKKLLKEKGIKYDDTDESLSGDTIFLKGSKDVAVYSAKKKELVVLG